jgi:hypothetical protein
MCWFSPWIWMRRIWPMWSWWRKRRWVSFWHKWTLLLCKEIEYNQRPAWTRTNNPDPKRGGQGQRPLNPHPQTPPHKDKRRWVPQQNDSSSQHISKTFDNSLITSINMQVHTCKLPWKVSVALLWSSMFF